MAVKLIDFINTVEFNEQIDIFDNDDNVIFLGKKRDLLEKLYSSQILAIKTITQIMIIENAIVINVK